MAKGVRTLVVGVGLPLLFLVLLSVIAGRLDSQWLSGLAEAFPEATPGDLERARLGTICADPAVAVDVGELCSDWGVIAALRLVAVGAAAVGAVLAGIVFAASILTVHDRRWLARLFGPGLKVLVIGLVVLIILDGAMLMGVIYYGEAAFVGYVHIGIVLAIGLTVLLTAIGMISAALRAGRSATARVVAYEVERDLAPRLFELIDGAAATVGTSAPDQVLMGLDPNFYVTEVAVRALDKTYTGRTLYLSAPYLRILEVEEVRSVVGHELAHFSGADTEYAQRFYPIYRGAFDTYRALSAADGISSIVMLPAIGLLGAYVEAFATAESRLSRDREMVADGVGASISSAMTVATALAKIHAFVPTWSVVVDRSIESAKRGAPEGNLAKRFGIVAAASPIVHRRQVLTTPPKPHPTDTHPPLQDRLVALGVDIDAVLATDLSAAPGSPGSALLIDPSDIEERLTKLINDSVATSSSAQVVTKPDPTQADAAIERADQPAATSDDPDEEDAPAIDDPVIARLFDVAHRIHGADLVRLPIIDEDWVVVGDLIVEAHPDPGPYESLVLREKIPGERQWLAVAIADDASSGQRLRAGTRLRLVGHNAKSERIEELEEDFYAVRGNFDDGVLVVRGAQEWPIEHSAAGLFVVPISDAFAALEGPVADELAEIVFALRTRATAPPAPTQS